MSIDETVSIGVLKFKICIGSVSNKHRMSSKVVPIGGRGERSPPPAWRVPGVSRIGCFGEPPGAKGLKKERR